MTRIKIMLNDGAYMKSEGKTVIGLIGYPQKHHRDDCLALSLFGNVYSIKRTDIKDIMETDDAMGFAYQIQGVQDLFKTHLKESQA